MNPPRSSAMFFKLIVIISVSAVAVEALENCVTPDNLKGACITLYKCPVLLKALGELATQHNATTEEFVRKSSCGGTASTPKVCCSLTKTSPSKEITDEDSLLNSKRFCGYQHSDDYFHDTNGTVITEFPWLARIRYKLKRNEQDPGKDVGFLCSGSLINERYVLTAAHCAVLPFYIPTEIRLGDYNIVNETDCVGQFDYDFECSNPLEDFSIEKAIVHPEYCRETLDNDIALIRLNRTVVYSDYIRPICVLPLPTSQSIKLGDTLTLSGWGINKTFKQAEIKTKILSRIISNEDCAKAFADEKWIQITDNHICTRPLRNYTNVQCQGDAGGPVMVSHRAQWHQEGISCSRVNCGRQLPEVHTRVANYLDWIQENLYP